MPNLDSWAQQAIQHWKEFRPSLYRELKSTGKLDEAAQNASDQTEQDIEDLVLKHGMPYQDAWEAVRERYLFLPSEEDVPNLGESPDSSPDPSNLASTIASRAKNKSARARRNKKSVIAFPQSKPFSPSDT